MIGGMDNPVDVPSALYVKHGDVNGVLGDLTFILCSAMDAIVQEKAAVAAQRIRGIWLLYVNSDTARLAILSHGHLSICDKRIQVHDRNPFAPRPQTERVIIRDYPFTEPNDPIINYLQSQSQIKLHSNILPSLARNNKNELSTYTNGDRVIEVEADFSPPLPKEVTLGNHQCRIYHATQQALCFRCQDTDHYTGDTMKCTAYINIQNQQQILAFKSPRSPLTNYWQAEITMDGVKYASAEHAYQWLFCVEMNEPELAERVYQAASAADAKSTAKQMPTNKIYTEWSKNKLSMMKKVLKAKAESNKEFVTYLLNTGDKYLVEATKDTFYGSGLSPYLSRTTDPSHYPGSNHLGKLLMELREHYGMQLNNKSLTTHSTSAAASTTNPPSTPVTPSGQHGTIIAPGTTKRSLTTVPPSTSPISASIIELKDTIAISTTTNTISASATPGPSKPNDASPVLCDNPTKAVNRTISLLKARAGSGKNTRKPRKTASYIASKCGKKNK